MTNSTPRERFAEALSTAGLEHRLARDYADVFIADALNGIGGQECPVFIHMLGFAGAGKSTAFARFLAGSDFGTTAARISFDVVMENLPSYQEDRSALGAKRAFGIWERPARALGYELLAAALKRRVHVALDHSGAAENHPALLRAAKDGGYRVVMVETRCTERVALARLSARNAHRHAPDDYVARRRKIIERLRPAYAALADRWVAYDTSGPAPLLQEDRNIQ